MADSIEWLVFDLGGALVKVAPADHTMRDLSERSDRAQSHLADAATLEHDLAPLDIRRRAP